MLTESNRILIRSLAIDDVDRLFTIYTDKEAMKYRGSKPFETITDVYEMLENTQKNIIEGKEFRYAVIEKETPF